MIRRFSLISSTTQAALVVSLVTTVLIAGCRSEPMIVEVTATPAPTHTVPPPTATPAPTTVTVCSSGCDYTTIQAVIDDAAIVAGSIIEVADAVHTEGDITINKDVTILGQGADATIIQAHEEAGEATDRVFFIEAGTMVVIRGVTIRHGNPDLEPRVTRIGRTGGGIVNWGTLILEDCVVRDNVARAGGGIVNMGDLTISNCTISDNVADGVGEPGRDCSAGAGIRSVEGPVRIVNSTLSGNRSSRTGGSGGALHVACNTTMVITNSTISGNHAGTLGGGAHVRGALTLVNCTVSGNGAEGRGRGGDIYDPSGGGIYISENGTLDLVNTIIANNNEDGDCTIREGGAIGDNVNSLDGDGSCGATYSGDPLLGPLADNGGQTLTHALLPDSPAVDAVECDLATDQRGESRQGDACDIGAFEVQAGME
jgi:hypothetical protein